MYVVCVQVHVKGDRVDEFARAAMENAAASRGEPGNMRFDVLQAADDPTRFILYEVYRSPEDFKRHQEMPHYLKWKEEVKEWMAESRSSTKCRSLFPPDDLGRW
jgi:(4S)-4-hydroxy-5-phosphonooxypentane-2,3-dione isomerase